MKWIEQQGYQKRDDIAALGKPSSAGLDSLRDTAFTLRLRRDELSEWRVFASNVGWTLSELIRDAMHRRIHGD